MILFSTLLSINESMSKNDFIELIMKWNQGSPYKENVIEGMEWNGDFNIKYGDDKLWLEIEEYRNENIIAVRYEKTESDGVVWDTDYVMNFNDMKMAITLDRSYHEKALNFDPSFSAPHFIRLLIEHGYVEKDEDIDVVSDPIFIDYDNMKILIDTINGESSHRLPVVYISKTRQGENPVNIVEISKRLKGIAHVLVQKGNWINAELKEACNGKNEYYGAIGIYYPNPAKEHKKYFQHKSNEKKLMELVVQNVLRYCNSIRLDTLYSWQGVKRALLLDKYNSQKEKYLAAECEKEEATELFEIVDSQIQELELKISRLTRENEKLSNENLGLKIKIDSLDKEPILFSGIETDLYPGEIREILLDIVNEKLESVEPNSRRYDILKDIIENNEYERIVNKKKEDIKRILTGYKNMSSKTRNELKAFGFEMIEDGKHCKLVYCNDERYKTVVSKTGSDHRGGINTANTIIKNML